MRPANLKSGAWPSPGSRWWAGTNWDAYGDSSVLDVLQRLPGISIDGETPRLRGMGEGYTVVLINGEPAPPGFSMDTLAPADIERIEVTKGPTAEHGGAAGVINIILRVPPKLRQREWRASLGYRAVKPQGNTSGSWGDRLGEGAQTAGFPSAAGVLHLGQRCALAHRTQQPHARWRRRAAARSPAAMNGRAKASASARVWTGSAMNSRRCNCSCLCRPTSQKAVPGARPRCCRARRLLGVADESQSQGDWQLQRANLQWVRRWPSGVRLELKAGGQSSLSLNEGQSQAFNAAGDGVLPRNSSTSNRDQAMPHKAAACGLPVGEAHTLALGWDLEARQRRELRRWFENGVERVTGSLGIPFTAEVARTRLFVQEEWAPTDPAFKGFSALAGLRLESLRIRTADPDEQFVNTSTTLAPVFNLRHAVDGAGKRLLRLGVSRSLRVPDVGTLMPRYSLNGSYERQVTNTPLAADSAGNPQLQPERATGVDLALEQHLSGGGVLSASVFHRQISGLIRRRIALETDADASVPAGVARWVSRPANFGRARSSGMELEVKGTAQQLLPADWAASPALRLRAALSLYRSRVEQVDDPEARLEGQPPWQATLGFDRTAEARQASGISFGASYTHVPAFSTQQTDLQRVWRGCRSAAGCLCAVAHRPPDAAAPGGPEPADAKHGKCQRGGRPGRFWRPVQQQPQHGRAVDGAPAGSLLMVGSRAGGSAVGNGVVSRFKALQVHAGPRARAHLREHGLRAVDVRAVPAAAGGPKGLVLLPMDEFLFGHWLQGEQGRGGAPARPVHLLGASIGAWRMAAACAPSPAAALATLAEDYITQTYPHKKGQMPTAAVVSEVFGRHLQQRLAPLAPHLLAHPRYRLHVFTSRGRRLLHRPGRVGMVAGWAAAFAANALGRQHLASWMERVVFSDPRDPLPFGLGDYPSQSVALTATNLCPAVLASCSIPFALQPVQDVPGGPPGTYWDGGITDYHLHLNYVAIADGLVLYPHFIHQVVPGWLDKAWKSRHLATPMLDNLVLLSPRPDWVARLPGGKLPDRQDFKTWGDDEAGRQKLWRAAHAQSRELADELSQLVHAGQGFDALPLL